MYFHFTYSEYFRNICCSISQERIKLPFYSCICTEYKSIMLLPEALSEEMTLLPHWEQTVCMPGQWLTRSVASSSFSSAHWGVWGPVPTATVLKYGRSLGPPGSHLWHTFHDSSPFRRTIETLWCPLFALRDRTSTSVFCQKQSPSLSTHV